MDRKGYIGSSDIAAIMGEHPYRSAMQVYAEKLGLSEPFAGNEATWLGNIIEPEMAAWYAQLRDVTVTKPGQLTDQKVSYFKARPDGLSSDGFVLEIKSTNPMQRDRWGEPGTDEVPPEVLLQVQWEMMVAQAKFAHVAVNFLQRSKELYAVSKHDKLVAQAREAGREFWEDHVLKEVPPDPGSAAPESQKSALLSIYPKHATPHLQATPSIAAVAADLRKVRQQMDLLGEKKTMLEGKLMQFIGDGAGIEGWFGRIDWKLQKGKPSYKSLFEQLTANMSPDQKQNLIESSRGKPSRVFRPYWS